MMRFVDKGRQEERLEGWQEQTGHPVSPSALLPER